MDDRQYSLGGVGRGAPLDRSKESRGNKSERTVGLYGVDCDFARKSSSSRGDEVRYKSRDEGRRGKSSQYGMQGVDDLGSEDDEYYGGGSHNDGRQVSDRRVHRVRFAGIDSDNTSRDTSNDEGIPQFGARGRNAQKNRDVSKHHSGDRYETHPKRETVGDNYNNKPSMIAPGAVEFKDLSTKLHRELDYLRLDSTVERYRHNNNNTERRGDRGYREMENADSRDEGRGWRGGLGRYGGRGGRMYERRGIENDICYNCGVRGHHSRDCTEPRLPMKSIICFTCRKEGHIGRFCPQNDVINSSIINDSPVANLRSDNGSDSVEMATSPDFPSLSKDPFENPPLIVFSEVSGQPKREQNGGGDHQEALLIDIGSEESAINTSAIIDQSFTVNVPSNESITVSSVTSSDKYEMKHDLIQVEQLCKKTVLQNLVLNGGENFKDSEPCKCTSNELFVCNCKTRVLVFVNRRMTIECIRAYLAAGGVTAVYIHDSMNEHERQRNLAQFANGRYPILLMMASTIGVCANEVKDVSWLINVDLPTTINEFNRRIDMCRPDGKSLLVTSFYDTLMDNRMAGDLVKVLNDAGGSVPEWLMEDGALVAGNNSQSTSGGDWDSEKSEKSEKE